MAVNPSGASRRYAPAKTPLQSPGPRFRPDVRQDLAAESSVQEAAPTDWGRSALDYRFRPAEKRRKPVYQPGPAAGATAGQPPGTPYVAYAPPPFPVPPMYGGYWPRW